MYNEAELVHWRQNPNKVLLPAQVDIDLTNICNQDCYYCNSADHRKAFPVQKEYKEYIVLLDRAFYTKKLDICLNNLYTIKQL